MDSGAIFSASNNVPFVALPDTQYASLGVIDGLKRIVLRGVCLDSSVNKNNWQVPEDELEGVAERSIGSQIRLDHSGLIRDVKGKILSTEIDEPHENDKETWDKSNKFKHVHYVAELISNDANILIPILQGYVDHVSIGVDSKNVFCSTCGEPTRPGKSCDCKDAWEVVKNARVNEYSIVCSPAYENTKFVPYEAKEKECDPDTDEGCEKKVVEVDKNKEIADKEIDENQEIASIEEDDNMDDEKLESLIAMVEKLAASNNDLVASNNELLTRIAAIEAEEDDEEEDEKDKKASKDDEDKEEEDEKEATEEVEEKEACNCGKGKKIAKKASIEGKEIPVKKVPIEAGIVIKTELKADVPVDSMELAKKEIFGFAARLNIIPLETMY